VTRPPNVVPTDLDATEAEGFLDSLFARIDDENPTTNAVIRLTPDQARADLVRVLAARSSGEPLPLDGSTFVVKDNIDVGGVPGTLGSHHFLERTPTRDADVVRLIRAAGGILLGLANLHELAFGGTSENPHFGTVRNPWASDRNVGGSSGGSAVAVALDWVTASLGSDTGGSVRCPAAIVGITGLRPTFGAVSSRGMYPLAPSFDTVGFMARDATVVEQLLALSGGSSLERGAPAAPRIGIPRNPYFTEGLDAGVAEAVAAAAREFERSGAELVDVEVPDPERSDHVARLLVRAEAWRVHGGGIETAPQDFGRDVVDRLLLGKAISPAELESLAESRSDLSRRIDTLWDDLDVVLLPTVKRAPRHLESDSPLQATEQNLAFTYLWGIGGLPAMTLPAGYDDAGFPVGVQLVARRGADGVLCALGTRFQGLTDWHTHRSTDPRPDTRSRT
jgi:aspartyl-tRNA(Asn)/glutamyl-tRNA(Gln) amidotransferase subunit A